MKIGTAFRHMVEARTNVYHAVVLWFVIGALSVGVGLWHVSIDVVPEIFRSLRNPAATKLAGYAAT
jgi:hypothetical protein